MTDRSFVTEHNGSRYCVTVSETDFEGSEILVMTTFIEVRAEHASKISAPLAEAKLSFDDSWFDNSFSGSTTDEILRATHRCLMEADRKVRASRDLETYLATLPIK